MLNNIATSRDFAQANNCGASLPAGSNCAISVTFTPTTAGNRTGTLTITDNAGNSPQTVALTGTGVAAIPIAALSPTGLTFPSLTTGTTSAAQSVTLINSGQAALMLNNIATSGDFAQANSCGPSLAAGSNCAISVTFTPTAAGIRTGMLTVTDNAGASPQAVTLSGTGITPEPNVSISPTTLTFSSQTTGSTSAAQTITITNSGTAALGITSVSASGDFAETNTCGVSVAPSANCAISVTFTPTAPGTRTGILTITDSATASPQIVAPNGTGADVTVASSSSSLLISSTGGSATANIQVASAGGFSGTVSLACKVAYQGTGTPTDVPACALNPMQEQVTGASPASATLTVSTTAAVASVPARKTWQREGPLALAALLLCGVVPRRRWRGLALILLSCVVVVGTAIGCGGASIAGGTTAPSNPGAATGNYSVTVTATSGAASASLSIPLSVQ